MAVFHSMTSIMIYTFIAVALLLWYGTGKQPFAAAYVFVRSLVTSPKYLLFFLGMLAILLLNKYELKLEALFPIHYDLTSRLVGWEGGWQGRLQQALHSDVLTLICASFYLVAFQAVMIASVGIYTYKRNLKLYYAFCVALLLNYFIAVPFFLFVPVNEAWFAGPNVSFLMLDAFPRFEAEYRHLSGLNNCFPSLHTSISVTMALLAARSGNRRWALFAGANAVIILFSIFYLGIHWFSDMLAGLCLAATCAWVGLKVGAWADRRTSAVREAVAAVAAAGGAKGAAAAKAKAESGRKWAPSASRYTGS